jgi:hypothetical protein
MNGDSNMNGEVSAKKMLTPADLLASLSKPPTRTDTRLFALSARRDALWQELKNLFPRVDMSLARDGRIYWHEQPDAFVREEGARLTVALNECESELATLEKALGIEKFVPTPAVLTIKNSTTNTEMWQRGAADWQRPRWK